MSASSEEVVVPHRIRLLAMIGAAGIALALTGCSGHASPRSSLLDPAALALESCKRVAEADSTGGTPSMTYAVTTAGAAEQLLYGSASRSANVDLPSIPVVALVAVGSFDGSHEKGPPGVAPVGGTVVSCVAALNDGGVMDWGEGDVHYDLTQLGTPILRF